MMNTRAPDGANKKNVDYIPPLVPVKANHMQPLVNSELNNGRKGFWTVVTCYCVANIVDVMKL